MTLLEAE